MRRIVKNINIFLPGIYIFEPDFNAAEQLFRPKTVSLHTEQPVRVPSSRFI